MKQTFSYCSKSVIKDNMTELLVGVALIVGPIIFPFGIKIGATRILGPLPTAIILILVGLYMSFRVFKKYRQARILASRNSEITVEDERITYPMLKKGAAAEGSFVKSDISSLNYNQDDGILTVTLKNGGTIKFDVDFFESLDRLKEFAELLRK